METYRNLRESYQDLPGELPGPSGELPESPGDLPEPSGDLPESPSGHTYQQKDVSNHNKNLVERRFHPMKGLSKKSLTRSLRLRGVARHEAKQEAIRNTVIHWIASGCALAMTGLDPFETPSLKMF
jgi:hypothetical protein